MIQGDTTPPLPQLQSQPFAQPSSRQQGHPLIPVQRSKSSWVPAKKSSSTRACSHIGAHGSLSPTPTSSPPPPALLALTPTPPLATTAAAAAVAATTATPGNALTAPVSEKIILRINIPTPGIEMKLTRRLSRASTIKDVIETCKSALNLRKFTLKKIYHSTIIYFLYAFFLPFLQWPQRFRAARFICAGREASTWTRGTHWSNAASQTRKNL